MKSLKYLSAKHLPNIIIYANIYVKNNKNPKRLENSQLLRKT